jgi:uridylate kinase
MEHGIPIIVFNFQQGGNIVRAVSGERVGTRVLPAVALTPSKNA